MQDNDLRKNDLATSMISGDIFLHKTGTKRPRFAGEIETLSVIYRL